MSNTEIQVNQSELHQYSRNLSKRLADYYFIDHNFIEGKDILKFCDIKQVNLFLLKNLFEKWQGETSKLESPYFDFAHVAVKQALQVFMNTLSQHIKVSREDFYPILTESIRETLTVIVQPLEFFKHEINKVIYQPPHPQKYKEISKYILINKKVWLAFVEKTAQYPKGLEKDIANQLLTNIFEERRTEIEPMQWALQGFSDMLHLDIPKLLGKEEEEQELPAAINFEKTIFIDDAPTVIPQHSEPAKVEKAPKPKLVQDSEGEEEEEDQRHTLNDAFKNKQPAANIAEKFRNAKVESLRNAISLNQKFLFINKLFAGDSLAFNDALDRLDRSQSYEEARILIHNEYAMKYGWNFEQEDTKNFMDLLERKFF